MDSEVSPPAGAEAEPREADLPSAGRLEARAPAALPTSLGDAIGPDRIVGRVLDAEGQPVRGAHLRVWDRDPMPLRGLGSVGIASTDERGVYVLRELKPQEHWLAVEGVPGHRGTTVRAWPGAPMTVTTLARSQSAEITVLDDAGIPVPRASVRVEGLSPAAQRGDARPTVLLGTTETNGVARLEGLEALEGLQVFIRVIPPFARQAELTPSRGAWDLRSTTLSLPRNLAIEGVVQDFAGQPLSRARVRCRRLPPDASGGAVDTADREGRFRLEALRKDHDYAISAKPGAAPASAAWSAEVIVAAGTSGCVVRCDPGSLLDLVVDGWPEGAYANAYLVASDQPYGEPLCQRVDGRGRVRFEALDPRLEWVLQIDAPPSKDVCAYVQGLRTGLGSQHVEARPSRTVVAHVTAPPGVVCKGGMASASGFRVSCRGADRTRLEFRGVPEDLKVSVSALGVIESSPTETIFYVDAADAPSGTDTVHLTLRPTEPR